MSDEVERFVVEQWTGGLWEVYDRLRHRIWCYPMEEADARQAAERKNAGRVVRLDMERLENGTVRYRPTRPIRLTPDRSRREQAVALVSAGKTLKAAGVEMGLTRERVRQLLAEAGHRPHELRDVRCTYCGQVLRSAHTGTDLPTCSKRQCRTARGKALRARLEQSPRARCSACGKKMNRPADGETRFCVTTKECRAARKRHLYATNPEHRAKVRAYQAQHKDLYREYTRRYMERKRARMAQVA